MILPDVNLLIYAYNTDAPDHQRARGWWEESLSGERPVGLPWVVMLGFLRLMTSRSVLVEPLPAERALGHLRAWLDRPQAQILNPGPRHLALLETLTAEAGSAGRLTTDIYLAAIAIECQAEICSNDSDFGRFSGLRWSNPLAAGQE